MVNNLDSYPSKFIESEQVLHRILMPLLYFEIFSYPLTTEEIRQLNPGLPFETGELKSALDQAVKHGLLFEHKGFYSTQNKPEWVARRQDNNQRAERYIRHAYRMTHLIRRFPFVRGVFLSGALSKNVMPRDGDIDYFIITKPGRLWVSRTLLVLFKKFFLLNSHKYFCVNYFVDTAHLTIEEKNLFTATEIVTLVPLYNQELYQKLLEHNDWVLDYYPNFPARDTTRTIKLRNSKVQQQTESVLAGSLGERLDTYFFRKTLSHWQKKFANFDARKFANALKSRPHVSKHHPQDFQNKVLQRLEQRIQDFEKRNQLQLERTNRPIVSLPKDS